MAVAGGAVVIRYDSINPDFFAVLLLQLANFTYAAERAVQTHGGALPQRPAHFRRFGYFYLGALLVVL